MFHRHPFVFDLATVGTAALVHTTPATANQASSAPTVVTGLDQPASLEFSRKTAFVVTLTGTVLRIDGISAGR